MLHRNVYAFAFIFSIFLVSCTTSKNPFFSKKSAHVKYGDALKNAGLEHSELAKSWFAAAQKSLMQPLAINLPYKEAGYFAAEKPAATGLLLKAKRGEAIIVRLTTIPKNGAQVFTELWRHSNGKFTLLKVIDTTSKQLEDVIKKDGDYILRIQPELLENVEYVVTITTRPSLAFPVDSSGKPKIISRWGLPRDAGARKHEGVDIAATFRSPALAATDGFIGRVRENRLGGKVVFLFDPKTQNNLYYAHLDSQIASPGESVKAGDTIGLIGKTGNAIHTIPHLHFGIYTSDGAIDPLPFIDRRKNEVKPITSSITDLNRWLRIRVTSTLYDSPASTSKSTEKLRKNDAVFITAATGNWFKIKLPTGVEGFIESKDVTDKITIEKSKSDIRLLDSPDSSAPAKMLIPKDEMYKIAGNFNKYYLAEYNGLTGWVLK